MNPHDDFDLKDYEIVSYTMPSRGEYYQSQDTVDASAVVWTNIPGGDTSGTLRLMVTDGDGNPYVLDLVTVQIPFRPASDPIRLQGNLPSGFVSGYFSCEIDLLVDGAIVDGVFKKRAFVGLMNVEEFDHGLGAFRAVEHGYSACENCSMRYGFLVSAVNVNSGKLGIQLPPDQTDNNNPPMSHGIEYVPLGEDWRRGGKVQSVKQFRYGFFYTKLKMNLTPSHSWCSFWLYNEDLKRSQSITFEMYKQGSNYVNHMALYYNQSGSAPTYTKERTFSSSTSTYHYLAIDWKPNRVRWYMDDNLLWEVNRSVPDDPMVLILWYSLYCNPWWTTKTCEIPMPFSYQNWVACEYVGW